MRVFSFILTLNNKNLTGFINLNNKIYQIIINNVLYKEFDTLQKAKNFCNRMQSNPNNLYWYIDLLRISKLTPKQEIEHV